MEQVSWHKLSSIQNIHRKFPHFAFLRVVEHMAVKKRAKQGLAYKVAYTSNHYLSSVDGKKFHLRQVAYAALCLPCASDYLDNHAPLILCTKVNPTIRSCGSICDEESNGSNFVA